MPVFGWHVQCLPCVQLNTHTICWKLRKFASIHHICVDLWCIAQWALGKRIKSLLQFRWIDYYFFSSPDLQEDATVISTCFDKAHLQTNNQWISIHNRVMRQLLSLVTGLSCKLADQRSSGWSSHSKSFCTAHYAYKVSDLPSCCGRCAAFAYAKLISSSKTWHAHLCQLRVCRSCVGI